MTLKKFLSSLQGRIGKNEVDMINLLAIIKRLLL